jgi:DUF1680 family protein
MYSISGDSLYVNMYGGNTLSTKLKNGRTIKLEQESNYPWDGKVIITIKETVDRVVPILLRIPGWCKRYQFKINNITPLSFQEKNGYYLCGRKWKAGDKIELTLDMPATLIESNPLVEETKNRVTVKRGPVVYCLESADLPNQNIFDVIIPSSIRLQPVPMKISDGNIIALTGQAKLLQNSDWKNSLYKELNTNTKPINIKLIPYYAWANRGKTDMTVWLNVQR